MIVVESTVARAWKSGLVVQKGLNEFESLTDDQFADLWALVDRRFARVLSSARKAKPKTKPKAKPQSDSSEPSKTEASVTPEPHE